MKIFFRNQQDVDASRAFREHYGTTVLPVALGVHSRSSGIQKFSELREISADRAVFDVAEQ